MNQDIFDRFVSYEENNSVKELSSILKKNDKDLFAEEESKINDVNGFEPGEFENLVRSFYKKVKVQIYKAVCGASESDKEFRTKIQNSTSAGHLTLGGIISDFIMQNFQLSVASSSALAAMIVMFFFVPAKNEICSYWKDKL